MMESMPAEVGLRFLEAEKCQMIEDSTRCLYVVAEIGWCCNVLSCPVELYSVFLS